MQAALKNSLKNKRINLDILLRIGLLHSRYSNRQTAGSPLYHTKYMLKLEIVHLKNHIIKTIDLPFSIKIA